MHAFIICLRPISTVKEWMCAPVHPTAFHWADSWLLSEVGSAPQCHITGIELEQKQNAIFFLLC